MIDRVAIIKDCLQTAINTVKASLVEVDKHLNIDKTKKHASSISSLLNDVVASAEEILSGSDTMKMNLVINDLYDLNKIAVMFILNNKIYLYESKGLLPKHNA